MIMIFEFLLSRKAIAAIATAALMTLSGSDSVWAQDMAPYEEEIPGSEEAISMTPVPGGTFTMGTDDGSGEEGPAVEVSVDSFWIGTYEITWDQYDLFVKEELDKLRSQVAASGDVKLQADAVSLPTPPYVDMSFGMGRTGFPAINMTNYAAAMFTKWLSAQTGHFYRLPTEAEWEYACQAGSSAYEGVPVDEYAWHEGNSDGKYHQIGEKKPNGLGLYDMHGNVAEWTTDQYLPDYHEQVRESGGDNPVFLPDQLYPRALRGGGWQHEASELSCTNRIESITRWKRRDPQLPKSRWWLTDAPFVGFRVVRPAVQPPKEEMEKFWIDPIEDYN